LNNIQDIFTGDEAALIAVHNFGAPIEIDKISEWAKEKGVFLIEDVCNAIGATYQEKPLGSFGDAAIFSFGYAKIVDYGVGGAALIKDESLKLKVKDKISSLSEYSDYYKNKNTDYQSKLRELRSQEHAQTPRAYLPLYQDYSEYLLYKIDPKTEAEIQTFLGRLEDNIKSRAQKAFRYRNEIKSSRIEHIPEIPGQVYWRYNLLTAPEIRNDLIRELRRNDILVSAWFPPIVGLFEERIPKDAFPGSEAFSKRVLNLFVDQKVSQSDVSKAIKVINNF
jgi:dTDP-4-amino-4,6-dideoxygalactose transaminase